MKTEDRFPGYAQNAAVIGQLKTMLQWSREVVSRCLAVKSSTTSAAGSPFNGAGELNPRGLAIRTRP